MSGLGTQLEAILRSRLPKAVEQGGDVLAKELAERMKENTLKGTTFVAGRYKKPYQPGYREYRRKQGLSTSPTVMRAKQKRIERTKVEKVNSVGAKIVFENAKDPAGKSKRSATFGAVMTMHHRGVAKGGFTRQLFPYSNQHGSVPEKFLDKAMEAMKEVLNGR